MRYVLAALAVMFLHACAFTDAQLDVNPDPATAVLGPISEVESQAFSLAALKDARDDRQRVGWKKNGFGQNTAEITTIRPVEDLVAETVVAAFEKNSHEFMQNGRINITGTVDRFWFDVDPNFWTVEFMGDVQCTLNFTDTNTGEEIYSSSYAGTHSEKTGGGLGKTWTRVLEGALSKLMESIAYDDELAEVLIELE